MGDGQGDRGTGTDRGGVAQPQRQPIYSAESLRRIAAFSRCKLDTVRAQARRWGAITWARLRAINYASQFMVMRAYDDTGRVRHIEVGRYAPRVANKGASWIERYPLYYGREWVTHKILYSEEFSLEKLKWIRVK